MDLTISHTFIVNMLVIENTIIKCIYLKYYIIYYDILYFVVYHYIIIIILYSYINYKLN